MAHLVSWAFSALISVQAIPAAADMLPNPERPRYEEYPPPMPEPPPETGAARRAVPVIAVALAGAVLVLSPAVVLVVATSSDDRAHLPLRRPPAPDSYLRCLDRMRFLSRPRRGGAASAVLTAAVIAFRKPLVCSRGVTTAAPVSMRDYSARSAMALYAKRNAGAASRACPLGRAAHTMITETSGYTIAVGVSVVTFR